MKRKIVNTVLILGLMAAMLSLQGCMKVIRKERVVVNTQMR